MKYSLALSALAAIAMAGDHKPSDCSKPSHTATVTSSQPSATPSPPTTDNGYFGVISSRSASPIHLLPLTARGTKFYLGGGPPSSYCPAETIGAENCPPGNTTVLAGGDVTLGLGVVVPGGQQVYVAPDGALSYTVAHSAYIPEGSHVDGFSRTAPANGNAFGYLNFDTGFVACPAANATDGYQVFGQVAEGATFGEECLGFSALTVAVEQPEINCKSKMTSAPTQQPKFLPNRHDLGLVAVGFSGGQPKAGVDAAPMALIENGLINQLEQDLEYKVTYDGQVHNYTELQPSSDPDYRGMKRPKFASAVTQQVSEQVYAHASSGKLVLTLGGDHSIAIGTVSGTAKAVRERLGKDIAVIWVDAHADINTPETSESGNIHGMPVAFLTGLATEEREDVFGWIKEEHRLSTKKLVYIGLRDIDRGEKKILREHGIKAFSMHDIDRHGIGKVMDMALGWIGSDTPIHLSFDVDALDPMWAPSTGTPVRGGLTLREGDFIAECVAETGQLIALDLVEVNPSLDAEGAGDTVRAGVSIVRCALGDTLL
ncbi:hypothetical protein ACET3X_007261 [Alternaria dauci]|uniref:Arginase n=1 Tax=Alternaria dauci TaxID=48095 RepID=A0ABR3UBY3_9PLEO